MASYEIKTNALGDDSDFVEGDDGGGGDLD